MAVRYQRTAFKKVLRAVAHDLQQMLGLLDRFLPVREQHGLAAA